MKRLQRELGITFIHVTHGQDEALALADQIVVMNNGRIDQAGPAREVYNAPRTEFVARFMGGHNVITANGGKKALRADRTRLARNGSGMPATVTMIEYQGAHVAVTLAPPTGDDLTALLPEADFFTEPFATGDGATITWADADLHPLTA